MATRMAQIFVAGLRSAIPDPLPRIDGDLHPAQRLRSPTVQSVPLHSTLLRMSINSSANPQERFCFSGAIRHVPECVLNGAQAECEFYS